MARPWISAVWCAAGVGALLAAGRMHGPLAEQRRSENLVPGDDPLENAPPVVAFTSIALGGFRGIAADLLWLRAIDMQDHGQYVELVALSDWITKLQPRFPEVWSFQAWNLAFNVSVMFNRPEDRWRWVRHGIRLLRDEGMRYCPGRAKIYEELSWFFNFKIGEDLDDAHGYYKRQWAIEMDRVFRGPRPDFDALIAAPRSPSAFLQGPGAADLAGAIREAGFDLSDPRWMDPSFGPADLRRRLSALPAYAAWNTYLRARAVREVYKIDPERLRNVDEKFGPFDWRLPDAHSVYWADAGLAVARTPMERLSLERRRFQSMAASFVRGALTMPPDHPSFTLSPNLALLPRIRKVYEDSMAANPGEDTIRAAYRNFFVDAIIISFSYNRVADARRLYAEFQKIFPDPALPGTVESFVAVKYASFVESLTPGQAFAAVESALYQSIFWREVGDADQAAGFEQIALLIWRSWMGTRKDPRLQARVGLPPLEQLRNEAARRVRADLGAHRSSTPIPRVAP